MQYQAEFMDQSRLEFEAKDQQSALMTILDHAHTGDEFTLRSRRELKTKQWDGDIPWEHSSYWKVTDFNCQRVR
jgi:hypothetical protein